MDIEGTMQFILDQQAQFSSDIARLYLALQRTNEILGVVAERQTTTEETMESFAERQNKMEQNILEVGQTLLDVANAQERTSEILVSVAERQNQTEQNILVLGQSLLDVANAQERSNGILATLAETASRHRRSETRHRRSNATSCRASKHD